MPDKLYKFVQNLMLYKQVLVYIKFAQINVGY